MLSVFFILKASPRERPAVLRPKVRLSPSQRTGVGRWAGCRCRRSWHRPRSRRETGLAEGEGARRALELEGRRNSQNQREMWLGAKMGTMKKGVMETFVWLCQGFVSIKINRGWSKRKDGLGAPGSEAQKEIWNGRPQKGEAKDS